MLHPIYASRVQHTTKGLASRDNRLLLTPAAVLGLALREVPARSDKQLFYDRAPCLAERTTQEGTVQPVFLCADQESA